MLVTDAPFLRILNPPGFLLSGIFPLFSVSRTFPFAGRSVVAPAFIFFPRVTLISSRPFVFHRRPVSGHLPGSVPIVVTRTPLLENPPSSVTVPTLFPLRLSSHFYWSTRVRPAFQNGGRLFCPSENFTIVWKSQCPLLCTSSKRVCALSGSKH